MRRKYVEVDSVHRMMRDRDAEQPIRKGAPRRGENGAGWLKVILYTPIVLIGVYSMIGIGLILGG